MNHILMENRDGPTIDVETTESNCTTEREAALAMIRRSCRRGATVDTDRAYGTAGFVKRCHKAGVISHVGRKRIGSAINSRIARRKTYRTSIKVRTRIEEVFGWLKTVGSLRKTRLIGRGKHSDPYACNAEMAAKREIEEALNMITKLIEDRMPTVNQLEAVCS